MVVFEGSQQRRHVGSGVRAYDAVASGRNSGPYIPVDQIPNEIKRFFLKTKVGSRFLFETIKACTSPMFGEHLRQVPYKRIPVAVSDNGPSDMTSCVINIPGWLTKSSQHFTSSFCTIILHLLPTAYVLRSKLRPDPWALLSHLVRFAPSPFSLRSRS